MNDIAPLGPQQGVAPGQTAGADGIGQPGATDPLTQDKFNDKIIAMLGQQIFDVIMIDDGI